MNNDFADKLRQVRGFRSQASMAEMYEISASFYSALERGIKVPTYSVLEKIIHHSGKDANYWFGIDDAADTNVQGEKLSEDTHSGQNTRNNLSVDKMRLDTLSLFFRDRIIDEIDTVKDSTFDCIQENIEELYILLKKERKKVQGKSA